MKKLYVLCVVVMLPLNILAQDELWVSRYSGDSLNARTDEIVAMTLDNSGNICVTGYIQKIGSFVDWATIKYNLSGDTMWLRTITSADSFSDKPTAIAVDSSNNIYVTGYRRFNNIDFFTVKYNSLGDTVWTRKYNGSANSTDMARVITIDDSGYIYVSGDIYVSNSDFATIKYKSSGDTCWVRTYNGTGNGGDVPKAIITDKLGNIYVTGSSYGTSTDFLTIKYNSSGDTSWTRRYNGTGNGSDMPVATAIDDSGYIYVAGESYGSNTDYLTVKYKPSGDTVWTRRYNGTSNSADYPSSLAIDDLFNIYVTGYSARGSNDFLTIKYNSSGDTVWTRAYNNSGTSDDRARALSIHLSSGNVYVAGYTYNTTSNKDFLTLKYSSSGALGWNKIYNGPKDSADIANIITVDASENVYVAGLSTGITTGCDFTTLKYASVGNEENSNTYSNPRLTISKNPFIQSTLISFQASAENKVELNVYDVSGKLVKSFPMTQLHDKLMTRIIWTGTDDNGKKLPSGIYFAELKTNNQKDTKKIILIK